MSASSNLIAFIADGSKQFKVQVGSTLAIDKNSQLPGEKITFENVLLVMDGDTTHVGQPYVKGARVIGEVVGEAKADKVIVSKQKRRKGYKVRKGHNQLYTQVSITEILTK